MGQMTMAVMLGVDAGEAPESLEEGWYTLVAGYKAKGATVLPLRRAAQPHLAEQVPVVPLSVPPRELPAWSPEILAAVAAKTGLATSAGRWGITLTGADLGMTALGAVLRNAVMPVTRDQVERAVVLTVLPRLLQPRLDAQVRATWRRLIGSANMALASIAALAIPWTDVLQRAEAQHVLTWEPDGRLSAGTDVNDAPSAELDARAMVSLSWLESVGDLAEDSEGMDRARGEAWKRLEGRRFK